MTQRNILIGIGFFVVPSLIYVALMTRFSFNLFDPAYGWQVYNYYAMALADGRQSIPAEAIAGEGQYINGQVYLYYGVLPALLRIPLLAIVDLRTLPVSNLFIAAMLITGQSAMQLAILRIFIANGRTEVFADRCVLVLVSLASWLMSGPFLITQSASFYHEAFAAALMLVGIYTALLADDLLVRRRRPEGARLLLYALLAGLAVYARQTCAIGLYAITLALLLPTWRDLQARPGPTIAASFRRAVGPLLVLFVMGAGFIALAYFRTSAVGSGFTVENYGFYILGNNRPRLRTMDEHMFNLVRVAPNVIYMLFGGAELRESLICQLGGGEVVTLGRPILWTVFASLSLMFAAAGAVCLWRRLRARDPLAVQIGLAALGFLATALLVWSYVTAQYRYNAEVWPLVAWLMLIAMRDIDPTPLFGRWLVPALLVGFALSAISLVYIERMRTSVQSVGPRNRGSLRIGVPLAPELAALATAPGARDPEVIAIRNAFGPDPDLPPGFRAPPDFGVSKVKC